jgi:hypothetical protein
VELGGYVMLILVLCFWKDVETFSVCILNVWWNDAEVMLYSRGWNFL